METEITLERWDWPLFKAEPEGFEHIKIELHEPSQRIHIRVTISTQDASELATRLQQLVLVLQRAAR